MPRRKQTVLDERIAEIERERRRLQAQLKSLERAEGGERRLPSAEPVVRSLPPQRPAFRTTVRPDGSPTLASNEPTPPADPPALAPPSPLPAAPPDMPAAAKPRRAMDTKMASYLASGSFKPIGESPADHRVQRNQVFFLALVGLLALIIIVRVIQIYF